MNKHDLEERINQEYKMGTPDILSRIEDTISKTEQSETVVVYKKPKKKPFYIFKQIAMCAACLVLFISGISIGAFVKKSPSSTPNNDIDTHIYLDVNPSIELQLNSDNKVVSCVAGNDDAEAILTDIDLTGTDMNTAISAIIGSMYVNGYLTTDSNSILVSVDSSTDERDEELLVKVTEKINKVFEKTQMGCSIIAQNVSPDDALRERARENGVSVGKMHLIDKMIEKIDSFKEDDRQSLSNMSIKELNLMYTQTPNDGDHDPFDKDISTGEIGGFLNKEQAYNALISLLEINMEDVKSYSVHLALDLASPDKKMVYSIRIELDEGEKFYQIDCLTGELVDTTQPPKIPEFDFLPPESQGQPPKHDDSEKGFK